MVIGITGQIGAGKSTAAEMFKSFGASVIEADRIGHEVIAAYPALQNRLSRVFGDDIFDSRGRLKRKKLAERAFQSGEAKRMLNRLVHPYLLKEIRRRLKERRPGEIVVVDAALLLDWGMDREVDFVLVIHAGREKRFKRLKARGIPIDDAKARQRAQLPYRTYVRRADRVILNSGPKRDLRRKLRALWDRLSSQTG